MGYAKLSQNAAGIHLRLFSRAFIIHENRGTRPVLFINLDLGMASELLKIEVSLPTKQQIACQNQK